MAKITGPWLRGARKKLAGVVLQKGSNGGTIAREHVIPANPQTNHQMSQRILFATVTQACAAMSAFVDHSFEGVEYGPKSKRHFIKENLRILRSLAADDYANNPAAANAKVFATTKNVSQLIPNRYLIANGSLPVVSIPLSADANGVIKASIEEAYIPYEEKTDGRYMKLGDLLYAMFGVQSPGEMISMAYIVNSADNYAFTYDNNVSAGYQIPYTAFESVRLVFRDDIDLESLIFVGPSESSAPGEHFIENISASILEALDRTKIDARFWRALSSAILNNTNVETVADGEIAFETLLDFTPESMFTNPLFSLHIYGVAFVRSRKNGDVWLRSKADMFLAPPMVGEGKYNYGLLWKVARDAWFSGEDVSDSNRYLNEGAANRISGRRQ